MSSACLTFTLILLTIITSPCSALKAVSTNARLPVGRGFFGPAPAVFDGSSFIYIMGGETSEHAADEDCNFDGCKFILRYNLVNDTMQKVSEFPDRSSGGAALLAADGSIYYSGRRQVGGKPPVDNFLFRYNPASAVLKSVSTTLRSVDTLYTILTRNQSLLFFGNIDDLSGLYEHSLVTQESRKVTDLRFLKWSGSLHYDGANETVLLFGEYALPKKVASYDIAKQELEYWPDAALTCTGCTTAFTGTHVYTFGKFYSSGSVWVPDVVLKYDITAKTSEIVQVEGIPYRGELWKSAAVYVRRLNRIYVFGGYNNNNNVVEDVWYLDLNE